MSIWLRFQNYIWQTLASGMSVKTCLNWMISWRIHVLLAICFIKGIFGCVDSLSNIWIKTELMKIVFMRVTTDFLTIVYIFYRMTWYWSAFSFLFWQNTLTKPTSKNTVCNARLFVKNTNKSDFMQITCRKRDNKSVQNDLRAKRPIEMQI